MEVQAVPLKLMHTLPESWYAWLRRSIEVSPDEPLPSTAKSCSSHDQPCSRSCVPTVRVCSVSPPLPAPHYGDHGWVRIIHFLRQRWSSWGGLHCSYACRGDAVVDFVP